MRKRWQPPPVPHPRVKSVRDLGTLGGRLAAWAALVDLFPPRRRFEIADDPAEADAEALRNDWEAVGSDLLDAAERSR